MGAYHGTRGYRSTAHPSAGIPALQCAHQHAVSKRDTIAAVDTNALARCWQDLPHSAAFILAGLLCLSMRPAVQPAHIYHAASVELA